MAMAIACERVTCLSSAVPIAVWAVMVSMITILEMMLRLTIGDLLGVPF
jgi:hypothetical protein